jgi:predicted Zn finger-like uncharacterized protein
VITVCPQCTQHLNVTAADLRRGHGNVRCGRCSAVFNGLVTLIEEEPGQPEKRRKGRQSKRARSGSPRPGRPPMAGSAGTGHTPSPPTSAATRPGDDSGDDLPVLQMAELDARLAALVERFQSVQAAGESSASAVQAAPAPEPEPAVVAAAVTVAVATTEPALTPDPVPAPEPEPAPVPAPALEPQLATSPDPVPEIILLTPEPRTTSRLWWGVVGVLALVLVAQIAHAFRHDLAQGGLAGSYGLVYGWFGADPLLPADPDRYEVRQLGAVAGLAQVGGTSRVRVRASVHNPGTQPLPLPWLRARLTDRYGTVLQQNDLSPADYLEGPVPAALQPDQRIDAALLLPDPGRDASGFELDACLPGLGGRLHCSAAPLRR